VIGGREIDDKFEFGGLLDRNVGGPCAFENFIYDSRPRAETYPA
jgi:hypothetical protein